MNPEASKGESWLNRGTTLANSDTADTPEPTRRELGAIPERQGFERYPTTRGDVLTLVDDPHGSPTPLAQELVGPYVVQ